MAAAAMHDHLKQINVRANRKAGQLYDNAFISTPPEQIRLCCYDDNGTTSILTG